MASSNGWSWPGAGGGGSWRQVATRRWYFFATAQPYVGDNAVKIDYQCFTDPETGNLFSFFGKAVQVLGG